jgi:N-acetylglucosaminyl-diphospho-decaprenol L-rhamnosyltransferase
MLLSVIIVNWNSTGYLLACLASLFEQTKGIDFEVIVVDNNSTDNGCELIADRFPQVLLVRSKTNLGFAKANNAGFAISKGEYLLFLNPDTVVQGNALATAVDRLSRLHDAGSLGCKLLNGDSTVQTSALLRFPTIFNQAVNTEFLQKLFPRFWLWGISPLYTDPAQPVQVEAISGACMFVKREAFTAAGMFDFRYFMYSEDVDLCYSIRKQGFKVYYTGDVRIMHYGGKSADHSQINNFNILMMKESTYTMLLKWRGTGYAGMYKVVFLLAASARILILLVAFPAAAVSGGARRIQRSIAKWITIFLWAAGNRGVREALGRYSHASS